MNQSSDLGFWVSPVCGWFLVMIVNGLKIRVVAKDTVWAIVDRIHDAIAVRELVAMRFADAETHPTDGSIILG
jgi:hypothetical protein